MQEVKVLDGLFWCSTSFVDVSPACDPTGCPHRKGIGWTGQADRPHPTYNQYCVSPA